MRLYAGRSSSFIQDSTHNRIAEHLKAEFFRQLRYQAAPNEVQSWRNSLRAVSQVFSETGLTDHGVLLEYQLPLTSRRLDCMITGEDAERRPNAVVIELKQWEHCETTDADDLVTTWVGGAQRDVLHPSAQVGQYRRYLEDTHTAFYEGNDRIRLGSCAYLHNYRANPDDPLFDPRFDKLCTVSPTFVADAVPELQEFLTGRLSGGQGMPVLERVERSDFRPSKKLMAHVANVIKGRPEYVLLDEQLVVYQRVLALARQAMSKGPRHALLIHGGPGTGKSVIATNLMGTLLAEGTNAHYATGSRAFTGTLRKILGARAAPQLSYFNNYATAEAGVVDVLICDEAHRIRKTSVSRFTKKEDRSGLPQIEELFRAARLPVFFVDDHQTVRPDEIGSASYIREHAERLGVRLLEYTLEAQFRCAGSDGFVQWVNNTLGIERTPNVLWDTNEPFEFRIFSDPETMEAAIRQRAAEKWSARMTAGFCWKWSKPTDRGPDGGLVEDVIVGDYRRPWNARPEATRLPPGIPKSDLWAHDPGGIEQVGCVYTAQGFEFDYVGVIFGNDLRYDWEQQDWVGHRENSHDTSVKRGKERFLDLVKNTYRVLLTRGLKGCYVCFVDKDTERFVRSRVEGKQADAAALPYPTSSTLPSPDDALAIRSREWPLPASLEVVPAADVRAFENAVPVVDLPAARTGKTTAVSIAEEREWYASPETWVRLPEPFRASEGVFVARVDDAAIDARVARGAWCVFGPVIGKLPEGAVVLANVGGSEEGQDSQEVLVRVVHYDRNEEGDSPDAERMWLVPASTGQGGIEAVPGNGTEGTEVRIAAVLVATLA